MPHASGFFRALLVLAPLLLVAAKCIENDHLYRDDSGDWHITGEIHNETDVQGVEMILQGILLDAGGSVLATGQAGICPGELSPGTFSTFDIEFHNSAAVPQPASYKVNVKSGRGLTSPLPKLDVSLSDLAADRAGDTVTVTATIRAERDYDGDFWGCMAFYNASGKMIHHLTVIGFGQLEPDIDTEMNLPLPLVPASAQSLRFWLVGPGDAPFQSDHAAIVSGRVVID